MTTLLAHEPAANPTVAKPACTSRNRARLLVRIALGCACVLIWLTYTGGRSPWIRLNLPGGVHGGNPVSGYTSLYNGDFYHKENFYALQHMDLIKGNHESFQERIGFCDRRMFYAIIGNTLTLVLNSYYALWTLNLAMFLLCAEFVRRMTETLFNDRDKGLLAAALFIFSTLATVHIGDLSPHFLALAFYYGWGILMVRLAQREELISLRENLGHAALLGLWSLTYTSFAFGLAVYLLILLRRKEWRRLVAPVAVCFLMPQLQLLVVRALGFGYSTDVEKILMSRGLAMHLENLQSGPLSYIAFLGVEFVNYLVNDNPLNVLIGLTVLIAFKHRSKWVLFALYLVPIAVVFPFIGTTTARGYVVTGNTIVLFPLVAHGVVEAGRWLRQRWGTYSIHTTVTLVLLVQIAWGQGSLVGWLYPTGSYGMGILKHSLIVQPTEFARMAGDPDDKPTLLGGDRQAAAYFDPAADPGQQPVLPARWLNPFEKGWKLPGFFVAAFCVELPVLLCVAGLLFFWKPTWWTRSISVALVILVPTSLLFGSTQGVDPTAYHKFEDRLEILEGETLTVRVQLSPEFRPLLQHAAQENTTAEIDVHCRGIAPRFADPAELAVIGHTTRKNRLQFPLAELIESVNRNDGLLKCRVTPVEVSEGIRFKSWQRNRPDEGRDVQVESPDGLSKQADWFPSVEIRVLFGENNYPLKPLMTRWDPARSVGYALIGF